MKSASTGRIDRAWHVACQHQPLSLLADLRHQDCRHQGAGIRVQRFPENDIAGPLFHDAPEVHDDGGVTEVLDHVQVVADEQVGQAEITLQVVEQVQDLRLHRDIERGSRLIEHDEAGAQGERAGNANALPLATGELVRVAVLHVRLQAHLLQQLTGLRFGIPLRRHAMDDEWARDDFANRAPRIQRRVRILEDDLHPPPHGLHLAATGARDLLPVKKDAA